MIDTADIMPGQIAVHDPGYERRNGMTNVSVDNSAKLTASLTALFIKPGEGVRIKNASHWC